MKLLILIVCVSIVLLCGLVIHLLWRVSSLEDRIERITLYLQMCGDGSPNAFRQCAEAFKKMGEAIRNCGVEFPESEEG